MKLATLACLSALCLGMASAHAAPADPAAKPETAAAPGSNQGAPIQAPSPAAPARTESAAGKTEAPRADKAAPARPRRISYAACNRASHQRGYTGGRRRRFLIRCRLGYERPRTNQHQAPAAPAPAPVRKP